MLNYQQKIFSIHFPDKKVYIENTCKSLDDKMEYIKNDKDHILYPILKDYPNPEIRFECFQDVSCYKGVSCYKYKKEVADKYLSDNYKILNFNLIRPPRFNLFQSLYKWMFY